MTQKKKSASTKHIFCGVVALDVCSEKVTSGNNATQLNLLQELLKAGLEFLLDTFHP